MKTVEVKCVSSFHDIFDSKKTAIRSVGDTWETIEPRATELAEKGLVEIITTTKGK